MQNAAVSRWLLDAKGISVQEEWLGACVEWIATEEGRSISQQRLQEMVYEQWLHADLKDVVTNTCIPQVVAQQQRGQINGKFIIQVDSVVDVGKPAYSQLQNLKGQSLDSAEGPDTKKFSEPKPTRLLLLSISDGVQELQAMEYQTIPQLNAELLPGTKMIVQGTIPFHLGVLLLSASHVQVLGGRVDQLVEINQPKRVLARLLNREELAGEETTTPNATSRSNTGTVVTHQQTTAMTGSRPNPPITNLSTSNHQSSHQSRRVEGGIDGSDLPNNETPSTQVEALGSDGYDGDIDMNDFEDFLNEAEVEEMVFQDDNNIVEEDYVDDIPGLDDDDHYHAAPVDVHGQDRNRSRFHAVHSTGDLNPTHMSIAQSSVQQSLLQEVKVYDDAKRTVSQHFGTKSKLTLKQKNPKSRTCPVSQPLSQPLSSSPTNPPIASVKPFQLQERGGRTVPSGGPVSLHSFSELTETSWKLCPMVKVKAHFVKVCQKLNHDSGEWMTTVVVCDDFGTELKVHICNKILEPLIGFSAIEFRDNINPNKTNLKVRAKASKGFAYCQSAIASLNCFMVLEKRPMYTLPFIVKLLDS